jgi:hypothetical protein
LRAAEQDRADIAEARKEWRSSQPDLRGLTGARDEFHLAAIVQNLKTLANHVWRPPPNKQAAACVA